MFFFSPHRVSSVKGKEEASLETNAITHWAIRNTIVTVFFFFFFFSISRKVRDWNYRDWRVNAGGTSELLKRHMIASQIGKIVAQRYLLSLHFRLNTSFHSIEMSWSPLLCWCSLFWCVPSISAPLLIVWALWGTCFQSMTWLAHTEHGGRFSCLGLKLPMLKSH